MIEPRSGFSHPVIPSISPWLGEKGYMMEIKFKKPAVMKLEALSAMRFVPPVLFLVAFCYQTFVLNISTMGFYNPSLDWGKEHAFIGGLTSFLVVAVYYVLLEVSIKRAEIKVLEVLEVSDFQNFYLYKAEVERLKEKTKTIDKLEVGPSEIFMVTIALAATLAVATMLFMVIS